MRKAEGVLFVRAMRAALTLALSLACYSQTASTAQPEPAEDQQTRMLDSARRYSEDYIAQLPNFVCEQTTQQFEAGRKPKNWHKGDTLTARLIYNKGKEDRRLERVNDKPITPQSRRWRTPLSTEGEFGILLDNILSTASAARFTWSRWDTLRGHVLAVFNYSIDLEHSTLSLGLSDLAKATLPYHGSIWIDPNNGAVWRASTETTQIPQEIRTRSIATTVDYDNVTISDKPYLLPSGAEVLMVTDSNHVRNIIQFAGYRKFEAESTITFGAVDAASGTKTETPMPAPQLPQ